MIWKNERWKVSDLKDHPQNPRVFTKKGMKQLEASFDECGYVETIAINTDGTILSGHARKKVLLKKKVKEVDVRVPERALTSKEQQAVLIRMNKNVAGEFDFDVLANEYDMAELIDIGFEPYEVGITLTDFSEVPGMPGMGEKINARIQVIVHFDTTQDKDDFIKQAPPMSYLHGTGDVRSYRYPPSDLVKSREWK